MSIKKSDLISRGWPECPLIGDALMLARQTVAEGADETDALALLDRLFTNPQEILAGEAGFDLAQAVLAERRRAAPPAVRDEPLPAPIWGRDLIDPQAIQQLENAMRLPVTVAGALMPDAHIGYGIPGSQGHASYVVRGLGEAASLNSASHGAGRQMSRKQAMKTITRADRNAWLAERGIELLAGGMDEAPPAYKDIEEVLALQTDLVEPVAAFEPEVVLIASDGKSEG